MNTAVINIKTQPQVKASAQLVARQLGVSLSSLINAFLRHLVKTKKVTFSVDDEEPSDYLLSVMKQADKDLKAGKGSPVFETGEEAVAWLEKQGI